MNFIRNGISRTLSGKSQNLDFDEEARALWAKLNLDPNTKSSSSWNVTDPIWRHPVGHGTIFVGNQTAAENINVLKSLGITHIVNCTYGFSKIPNFHEGKLTYFNFPISHWPNFVDGTDESIIAFTKPLFDFIDEAVANGESVLVHCLAGAHRAGTTGCACLIHFAGMDVPTAIATAKKCRNIIDPIGQLPDFLRRLHLAYTHRGGAPGTQYPSNTTAMSSNHTAIATTSAESTGSDRELRGDVAAPKEESETK